ncbi:hypothetical protein E2C01_047063 [Portunus trituberculatus]|uniref:Uncharacterized protein n=1 Tax=Portunus trituberculatus TaxID=210409 RepID=A0A5B7G6I7_PORTR|nr:hypothetical protein [Portunus trituberculatus]
MPQPKHGSKCSLHMCCVSPLEPESSGTTQYTILRGSPLSFLPSQTAGRICLTDAAAHTLPAAAVCCLKIKTSLLPLPEAKRSPLGPA